MLNMVKINDSSLYNLYVVSFLTCCGVLAKSTILWIFYIFVYKHNNAVNYICKLLILYISLRYILWVFSYIELLKSKQYRQWIGVLPNITDNKEYNIIHTNEKAPYSPSKNEIII